MASSAMPMNFSFYWSLKLSVSRCVVRRGMTIPFSLEFRSSVWVIEFHQVNPFLFGFKDVISRSWSLPVSTPGKPFVLVKFTLDWKRLLIRIYGLSCYEFSIWQWLTWLPRMFIWMESVWQIEIVEFVKFY